jgi:hypothetical protein
MYRNIAPNKFAFRGEPSIFGNRSAIDLWMKLNRKEDERNFRLLMRELKTSVKKAFGEK